MLITGFLWKKPLCLYFSCHAVHIEEQNNILKTFTMIRDTFKNLRAKYTEPLRNSWSSIANKLPNLRNTSVK